MTRKGTSTGEIRISHYRVDEELRRDALGYFFRAVDEQLDRTVILRVVRANLTHSESRLVAVRNRIRENARASARVNHPNLVTIYEFRSLAETDVVVMEFVAGDTIEAIRRSGRRWTVLDTARLIARLADALVAAHEAGLIHGNVTSSNVRVPADGRVKLLDLGVPKLEQLDDAVPREAVDDVRGLARVALEMLTPVQPEEAPPAGPRRDPLADPVSSRALFGFLAPLLTRALRTEEGFATAGEFRDAILLAMDMATGKGQSGFEFESGFATHPIGPDKPASEDELPADGRLVPLGRTGNRPAGPRLVLPPDLAERAGPFDPNEYIDVRPVARVPSRFSGLVERVGPGVIIGILLVAALGLAAWVVLKRPAPENGRLAAATVDSGTDGAVDTTTTPAVIGDTGTAAAPDSTEAATRPPAPSPSEPTVFDAAVRAQPAGTVIRALDDGRTWRDNAELSISAGDSIRLEFSRAGYITQRRAFTGSRIAVTLQPDSVTARFGANVAAEVFLATSGGERSLGTTGFVAELPTGRHRFVFRAPGQADWDTAADLTVAGRTYVIQKNDYRTIGSLLATVAGSWARVSVDGGPSAETPVRFDSLTVGRHILTVTREGYQTIVDTVVVSAGQITRRQYTIRR